MSAFLSLMERKCVGKQRTPPPPLVNQIIVPWTSCRKAVSLMSTIVTSTFNGYRHSIDRWIDPLTSWINSIVIKADKCADEIHNTKHISIMFFWNTFRFSQYINTRLRQSKVMTIIGRNVSILSHWTSSLIRDENLKSGDSPLISVHGDRLGACRDAFHMSLISDS